jgi:type I restriction enzyme M protein
MTTVAATVRQIQEIMRQDVGVDGDAQRISQVCWMFFLKILDDQDLQLELMNPGYKPPLPQELRWRTWAADPEGITGDELLSFVNGTLFPDLKGLASLGSQLQRRRVVRSVFEDAYNYMKSGQLLRQVINKINDIDFNNLVERQNFGDVYEQLLNDLQSAGNAGEYYTPRAVTNFMAGRVDPKPGEIILDPACGTGGFLTSSIRHMRERYIKAPRDEQLMESSLRAVEKKQLPHMLCTTNMLLHGIEDPAFVRHDNTLAKPYASYTQADRVDVVLTNPPFKGREEPGIESNFPSNLRTRDTADLFLALIMRLLKPGGRAAVVLPDSSLFGDSIKQLLREQLLEECQLHTIVRMPYGVFSPYTDIRTNLLFFSKGEPTKGIWFYELCCPTGEKYTKTKPIRDEDFAVLSKWWDERKPTGVAWYVPRDEIPVSSLNLDIGNPNAREVASQYMLAEHSRKRALEGMAALKLEIGAHDEVTGPGSMSRLLVASLVELASSAPLTSGVLEDARTALTELALRGDLTVEEPSDEDVGKTLARFQPAEARLRDAVSSAEVPFSIPKHWAWVRLAEITDFDIGRTPATRNSAYWSDSTVASKTYPWVSIKDMPRRGLVTATEKRVSKGAFAVFGRGPAPAGTLCMGFKLSVGKTAILGMDAFHNEAIAGMAIRDESLKKYLLWALPSLAVHASSNPAVRGNTLNSRSIAGFWVPIPPRQEQKRLVASLIRAVALVEKIALASQTVKDASDRALKLLVQDRVLSERVE